LITEDEIKALVSIKGPSVDVVDQYSQAINTAYDMIILDYDGTLTENHDWKPDPSCMEHILDITRHIPAVVISGRGSSLHELLKPILNNNLLLASYNGALTYGMDGQILADRKLPGGFIRAMKKEFGETLKSNSYVARGSSNIEVALDIANDHAVPLRTTKDGWIACAVDKVDILQIVGQYYHISNILKIGDEGNKGSNDELLLSQPNSFSVDIVSDLPYTGFPVLDSRGIKYKNSKGTSHLLKRVILK
jgi:hypothetical protein